MVAATTQDAPYSGGVSLSADSAKDIVLAALSSDDPAALDLAYSYCEGHSIEMDNARFDIGDIAAAIQRRYGKAEVRQLAKVIRKGLSTVYQYQKVSTFYGVEIRDRLKDEPLGYTHYRAAMKLGTLDAALAFLEEAADNLYTADEAARKVSERLGKTVTTTLFTEACIVKQFGLPAVSGFNTLVLIYPKDADVTDLLDARESGRQVQVTIKETVTDGT